MPIPIRPSWTPIKEDNKSQDRSFDLNVDSLAAAIGGDTGRITKEAKASDADAEVLFNLWKSSDMVSDSDNPSDRRYKIPKTFASGDLLRLKASSLISGDDQTIRFTSNGVSVIRTMLLAEENDYRKKAVRKPYNAILAEIKAMSSQSRLALAGSDFKMTKIASTIKTSSVPNIPIPTNQMPTNETEYVTSLILTNTTGTNYKEYVIRVYRMPDGSYSVLAFNGRIGGTLRAQQKGNHSSLTRANNFALEIQRDKIRGGYSANNSLGDLFIGSRSGLIGRPPRSSITDRAPVVESTRPSTPPRGEERARETTRPVSTPAVPLQTTPKATDPKPQPPVAEQPKKNTVNITDKDIDDLIKGMESGLDLLHD